MRSRKAERSETRPETSNVLKDIIHEPRSKYNIYSSMDQSIRPLMHCSRQDGNELIEERPLFCISSFADNEAPAFSDHDS